MLNTFRANAFHPCYQPISGEDLPAGWIAKALDCMATDRRAALDHLVHASDLLEHEINKCNAAPGRVTSSRSSESLPGRLSDWQTALIENFVETRIDSPLRTRELAELVGLSQSYFCRAFKTTYGVTSRTYVTGHRIECAKRLMVDTNEPLAQIALACGLSDQAHLSNLFRRLVGASPSGWRRAQRAVPTAWRKAA